MNYNARNKNVGAILAIARWCGPRDPLWLVVALITCVYFPPILKKVVHDRRLECLNCRWWACRFGSWRSDCQAGCTNAYPGTPARNWLSYSYKWRKLGFRHAGAEYTEASLSPYQ